MDEQLLFDLALHSIYATMVPSFLAGLLGGWCFGYVFRPARSGVRHGD